MAKLIFLGTSNAISDAYHENTHMVVEGSDRMVLIDCPNNPLQRFQRAHIDVDSLTDIIVTHFHPDHVSGVPQLLMNLWLMDRTRPIDIHGLPHTLDRLETLMGQFGWSSWPNFYSVSFHRLTEEPLAPVLESEEFCIRSEPVQHFIPTIGLRIEFTRAKKILAYSCDTRPCPQVVHLASGADILVHESSGALPGHSSAAQAGEDARQAEVGALYLVHYPTGRFAGGDLVAEARQQFDGPITLTRDFMTLVF